jgi:hypothetical protein
MKLRKILESILGESFSNGQFYHVTLKKNLESIKRGVDYKKIQGSDSSSSQGGGLYLFAEENLAIHWANTTNKGIPDVLLEFSVTDPEYLEVDVELMNYSESKRESYWRIYWNTFLEVLDSFKLNYYYVTADESELIKIDKKDIVNIYSSNKSLVFVVSKDDDLSLSDLDIIDDAHEGIKIQSKKQVGYFYLYALGNYTYNIRDSMISLKKFGIYQKFNQKILPKSNAFRYKGPIIYPNRYKVKDDSGNWGDWIENKDNK